MSARGLGGAGRGWGIVMTVLDKTLLHGAVCTISLCTWVREECDLDVGGHSTGS